MSIIEIDTGTQTEKYVYLYEDIDTCIVSSDDIDLSQEGFILKQGKHKSNPVEIKCKLVNKEDVIRRYDDWENMHSYFSGIDCFYKEMDGFIRIEPYEVPPGRINEFKYEKYLIDRGDQFPPIESHRYYKDISYDDVRFQRGVVTKYLTRHNPVYWNNKVVCGDLGDYVKNAMEELIYFRTDWLNNKSD